MKEIGIGLVEVRVQEGVRFEMSVGRVKVKTR